MAKLWEVDHPYYMTEGNYYQAGCHTEWKTWQSFVEEFADADLDYNWFVRWDWQDDDYNGDDYYRNGTLLLQMIGQRKALLHSHGIQVCHADEPAVREFLQIRWNYMKTMWEPFSGEPAKAEGHQHD